MTSPERRKTRDPDVDGGYAWVILAGACYFILFVIFIFCKPYIAKKDQLKIQIDTINCIIILSSLLNL